MQLFSRNKALAALSLGALAALGACGDDVTVPAPVNPPVQVTISPSNATVNIGAANAIDLAVSITGGTTTPTLASCTSSNTAVATVAVQAATSACRVTGVSAGSVSIVAATSAGQTASANVTVNAPVPAISGIAISPAATNLQVGKLDTIVATPTTTAAGATIARNFVSSNPAVATVGETNGIITAVAPGQATITVTLTGTGTGLSQAVVSGQVAVTVTALPPSVLGVSATPTSATLITGATQQITATASYATGITGSITYGTSNPGVAVPNETGLITAVGPGQAVITVTASSAGNTSFAAASATQQIPVTVNAPAQVSIANITKSQSNDPVNINDVEGQIQVQLNLLTNNNVVRSVKLFVCPVGGTCPTNPAAEQTFGTAGAASGSINMFINTADFTVASDWSDATVRYTNGQKTLVAQIEVQEATQANNNLAILNFDNSDAFAARHIAPTRSAVASGSLTSANNNLTFFGGPGDEGKGSVTVVPVIYTANRTVARASVNITGSACSNSAYTFVTGTDARPWTLTYGAGSNSGTFRGCAGTSSTTPDLGVAVTNVIDNAQNSIPVATFATTTSSVPAIPAPAVIRGDYQAPSISYVLTPQNGGQLGWANAAYNFAATAMDSVADAGVGRRARSTFVYTYEGCGAEDATAFTTNTGADIPECLTDFTGGLVDEDDEDTRGPYTATLTAQDFLGNEASETTDSFGVDKTKPVIEFLETSIDDEAIAVAPVGATVALAARTLDERAGFDDATAVSHALSFANQLNKNGICVVDEDDETPGNNFITNPSCDFGTFSFSGTDSEGYRLITPLTFSDIIALQAPNGYYSYKLQVVDRAGNMSDVLSRKALVYAAATDFPAITGMGLPDVVTSGANTFTPNFTETVESYFNSFRVAYSTGPTGDTLVFPATQTYTRFDDVIGSNGNTTTGTPFTSGTRFYTNLEYTAAGAISATPTTVRPTSAGIRITNVGGLASNEFFTNLLDANIADDATIFDEKVTNVTTFVVNGAAGFNAPAGIKAVVTANTNQINSPFDRIDFYRQLSAGRWEYAGYVNAKLTPCTSASQECQVYIADNGVNRVWSYVLRTPAGLSGSLEEGALTSGTYRAIATVGTAGRALSTNGVAITIDDED